MYANIALPLALPSLTYKIPAELLSRVCEGAAVTVPLRKKIYTGYVVGLFKESPSKKQFETKEILGIDQVSPQLTPEQITFIKWVADYYHYPVGEIVRHMLPPIVEEKLISTYTVSTKGRNLNAQETKALSARGGKKIRLLEALATGEKIDLTQNRLALKHLLALAYIEKTSRPEQATLLAGKAFPHSSQRNYLNKDQSAAAEELVKSIEAEKFQPFLLRGVTGSGKTEVYLSAAEYALDKGGSVLLLVPEIALTPQLFSRVKARLGDKIAILHSGLTARERSNQWRLIHQGQARFVLGARSTIFAPVQNLKLIIVDEEHESAFKQEDRLRYNARDMAILRAKHNGATVVLGSATPSLESYQNVLVGRYKQLLLATRFSNTSLPQVDIIDMRSEARVGSFTKKLIFEMERTLAQKKQVMIFQNRKGFASFILCESCGNVPECPNCSVSLTLYHTDRNLICHYCGFQKKAPASCEKCNGNSFLPGTLGTESAEKEIRNLFPQARVLRIDSENMKGRGTLEAALASVAANEVDIVVGTQMIAKGHDFKNLHLVAILHADSSFNIPDFRSSERCFQLFTQVIGRAGRVSSRGKAIIQTFNPTHLSVRYAAEQNYAHFAQEELQNRLAFQYPPYGRILRILISDLSAARVEKTSREIYKNLEKMAAANITILGPAPAVLEKIQQKYRWNILLKATDATSLHAIIKSLLPTWRQKISKSTNLQIDVDPVSLL